MSASKACGDLERDAKGIIFRFTSDERQGRWRTGELQDRPSLTCYPRLAIMTPTGMTPTGMTPTGIHA